MLDEAPVLEGRSQTRRVSGWLRSLDRFPGPQRATKSKQPRGEDGRERLGMGNLLFRGRPWCLSPRSFHVPGGRRSLVLGPGKEARRGLTTQGTARHKCIHDKELRLPHSLWLQRRVSPLIPQVSRPHCWPLEFWALSARPTAPRPGGQASIWKGLTACQAPRQGLMRVWLPCVTN